MKIFLDCGFYHGMALRWYIDQGIVDSSWEVYVFEPNVTIDVKALSHDLPVKLKVKRQAVWTKREKVTFHLAERNNASYIKGMASHATAHEVQVQAINFSNFVSKLPEDAYIICSMDIEGAEFPVLKRMLADDTARRIKLLDVEFHHRFMPEYSQEDAQRLIGGLEDCGVEVKLKVPLN